MTPKVSVVMPVFNAERHLAESIESVLCQDVSLELLAVDDCSQDRSIEILEQYAEQDTRIRVLRNNTNQKCAHSRNRAILEARGEFIALQDADDVSLPERLARQLDFLEHNPDYIGVGCAMRTIDETGRETNDPYFRGGLSWEEIRATLPVKDCIPNPTLVLRTGIARQYLFSTGEMYYAEDYELRLRLCADGHRLFKLSDQLVFYRVREQSVTRMTYRTMNPRWQVFVAKTWFLRNRLKRRKLGYFEFRVGLYGLMDLIHVILREPFRRFSNRVGNESTPS
jgi:glycosyltransferase involved in cell wall biosynthesis